MRSSPVIIFCGAAFGTVVVLVGGTLLAETLFRSQAPGRPGYEIAVAETSPATTTEPGVAGSGRGVQAPPVEDRRGAQPAPGSKTAPVMTKAERPTPPATTRPQGVADADASGDISQGAVIFKQCHICHAVGPDATNRIGPELNGIVGEKIAEVDGYSFSAPLQAYGAEHGTWTVAELTKWLEDPQALVPGTKMAYPGLADPKDIRNVIAYLASFDAAGKQAK